MRLRTSAIVLGTLALAVTVASPANAQICRGTADINSKSHGLFGGSFAFPKNETDYAAVVGGGGDSGFAVASIGGQTNDDVARTAFVSGFAAGAQIRTNGAPRVVVCPTGVFQTASLNDVDGAGSNLFDLFIGAGASVGFVAVDTPGLQVVPAFYIDYGRERFKIGDLVDNSMNGTIALGVGIVHNNFAVTPIIAIPIGDGSEFASNYFRVDLSLTFGKR